MRLRSLLFVPGDRPERISKASTVGADALILDLEDAVSSAAKSRARLCIQSFLRDARSLPVFVRINAIDSGMVEEDLAAIQASPPDGIVLPKATGAQDVSFLIQRIPGSVTILPIVAETPASLFSLADYCHVRQQLCGMTWGAEDLANGIGAAAVRDADNELIPPLLLARNLTLFAARAADIPAFETVCSDFRDLETLRTCAQRARRDGFSGMLAIHPSQVEVINAAFTPTVAEIEHAQAVVAAFAGNPGVGAVSLNGKLIDAPHLKRARALLEDFPGNATGCAP